MGKELHIKSFKNLKDRSKSLVLILGVVAMTAAVSGCGDDDPVVVDFPPSAPDGVFSVTGDGQVDICWNQNPESDIAGYDIYWNDEPFGEFEFIASVGPNSTCYTDTDVDNGITYFYAIAAFDRGGHESDLSFEDIFDTPRPEGTNLVMFDYLGQNSGLSGYDFSSLSGAPQAWDDLATDVYFGVPNGVPTLFADQVAGVDIQDYGFIALIDVDWAPTAGWSGAGQVELIQGHSYIVRIVNQAGAFNMAKVYVSDVSNTSVTLDWAYQIDQDNPELAPGIGGAQR